MESCRSGSDDLSDPQFADLADRLAEDPELRVQFQRLQEADGAIKAAFVDVPVPAGLADRVSRRLAEAARDSGCGLADSLCGSDSLADAAVTTPDCPAAAARSNGAVFATPAVGRFHRAFGRGRSVGRRLDPDSPAPARDARLRARRGHGLLRQG